MVLLLAVASCTQPDLATVTEWLGPQLHGEIRGEANGQRVDVIADAVVCQRQYFVPDLVDLETYPEGRLAGFIISFLVTIDGVERRYELELSDFTTAAVGTSWTVGSDENLVELRWEWEVNSSLVAYAATATGGMVELHELSGKVGTDGLVIPAGDGNVGAFVQLDLPDGEIAISFTAPCSVVQIDVAP